MIRRVALARAAVPAGARLNRACIVLMSVVAILTAAAEYLLATVY